MMNGGFKKGFDIIGLGRHLVTPAIRVGSSQVKSPLFKALSQLTGRNRSPYEVCCRAFSSDRSDDDAGFLSKAAGSDPDSKTSSGNFSANPNIEDCRTVLAVPVPYKPLIPGFYMHVRVKDPKLLAALKEIRKQETPYAGAFLLSNYASTDVSSPSSEILEKLRGKELLDSIHEVGTLAQISEIAGEFVTLIGRRRVRIAEMVSEGPLTIRVDHLKDKPYDKDDDAVKATYSEVTSTLRNVLETNSSWRKQVEKYTQPIGDFSYQHLADFGAGISGANKHQNQRVLEELDVHKRLKLTLELVKEQVEITKKQELEEDTTDSKSSLIEKKFREKIDPIKDKIPKHVIKVIDEELEKLQRSSSWSSEFDETYSHLDWLTVLPWGKFSDENLDVQRAEKILDEDHYGLSDLKERILEFIAVGRLRGTSQGKIICLSGPPGVGKTSIGRSIARALNREFFRFSVGGLADVAEIKGHRQTYVGATPGKLVQCLKSVGTENPLILIDEIDKIGRGHSGDPASALLEVMDPEQNTKFLDQYLNVPIDLSKVLFVCTANDIDTIPGPLLDRMEVIDLAGYLTDEKMHIARDYLLKSTCRDCGIKPEQVIVSDAALLSLIENYCREAGVRNLQKHIEKIYRKIALKLVRGGASAKAPAVSVKDTLRMKLVDIMKILESATVDSTTKQSGVVAKTVEKVITIDESNLADYVGKPVFFAEKIYEETPVGVVMGLAWTSMGGSTLYVETTVVEQGEGKGGLHITGRPGNVMKESAEIAHTVARTIMLKKEPKNTFFANSKLHLHFPEGSSRKEGPSAGCTIITSLLSLAMKKPVKKDLAMTGEVTLTGKILPIGGVREKTLAARRSQVKTIIFPEANRRDFDELPENMKEGLDVHFVDEYEQIFKLAFGFGYDDDHYKKDDKSRSFAVVSTITSLLRKVCSSS